MKKTTQILHLLLALSLLLLPIRGAMAQFGKISSEAAIHVTSQGSNADHHADVQRHDSHMADEQTGENSSSDCHGHDMADCDACAPCFTLKAMLAVSGVSFMQNLHIGYSVSVATLFLPSDIRPPIL